MDTTRLVKDKGRELEGARQVLSKESSSADEKLAAMKLIYQKYLDPAINVFKNERNLVEMNAENTIVVGDLHGNTLGFRKILEAFPPEKYNYVLIGDYIDRDTRDVELLALLLATKLTYPKTFTMCRGNHECPEDADGLLKEDHDFPERLRSTIGDGVVSKVCTQLFEQLPSAVVLNEKIFFVHGGIPIDDYDNKPLKLSQIKTIPKVAYTKYDLRAEQLLWNDFSADPETLARPRSERTDVKQANTIAVGTDDAEQFLKENKLEMVIRGHQHKPRYWTLGNKVITLISKEDDPTVALIEDKKLVQKVTVMMVRGGILTRAVDKDLDPNRTLPEEPIEVIDTLYLKGNGKSS